MSSFFESSSNNKSYVIDGGEEDDKNSLLTLKSGVNLMLTSLNKISFSLNEHL